MIFDKPFKVTFPDSARAFFLAVIAAVIAGLIIGAEVISQNMILIGLSGVAIGIVLLTWFYRVRGLVLFTIIFLLAYHFPRMSTIFPFWPDTFDLVSLALVMIFPIVLIYVKPKPKFVVQILIMMALGVLSMVFSVLFASTVLGINFVPNDLADVYFSLFAMSVFIISYWLARRYKQDYLTAILVAAFLSAAIQFVVASGQRFGADYWLFSPHWWRVGADQQTILMVIRPPGTTGSSNTLGVLMALLAVCFTMGLVTYKANKLRVISTLGILLSFSTILVTGSRQALLLMVLLQVLFLAIIWVRARSKVELLKRVVFSILLTIPILWAFSQMPEVRATVDTFTNRFDRLVVNAQDDVGYTARLSDWEQAMRASNESPLLGFGPAHSLRGRVSYYHSSYMSVLYRYGIVGFLIYLLPYLVLLVITFPFAHRHDDALNSNMMLLSAVFVVVLGVLIAGIVNHTFIGSRLILFLVWLLAGVALSQKTALQDGVNT